MTVHVPERDAESRPAGWTTTPPPTRDTSLAPEHVTETVPTDYKTVNGWGVDVEYQAKYPKELPSDVFTARGNVDYWQVPQDKVHLSIEHPNLTPVFGVSSAPGGLSGLLRDYAYNFGEGANRHWLTLLAADRVDILENLIGDIFRGRPDNYVREKGWSAKLKYEPGRNKRMMILGAIALGAVAAGVALYTLSDGDEDDD
ncbi:MAG TPA: hypothetical protein VEK11_17220 [Thermoanaerobaculia bacterium]|jgi:hypothetical protein|nr:hypothetical protein [Thermoanaerobaculia bacterium]